MDEWRLRASCRGMETALFFPDQYGIISLAGKKICAECPVEADCLEAGLGEYFGIWGGRTEKERRQIRRDRSLPALPRRRNACTPREPQERTELMLAGSVIDGVSVEAWLAEHRKTS